MLEALPGQEALAVVEMLEQPAQHQKHKQMVFRELPIQVAGVVAALPILHKQILAMAAMAALAL
jgi:hypothetical protein